MRTKTTTAGANVTPAGYLRGERRASFRRETRRAIAALARIPASDDALEARDAIRGMAQAAGVEY